MGHETPKGRHTGHRKKSSAQVRFTPHAQSASRGTPQANVSSRSNPHTKVTSRGTPHAKAAPQLRGQHVAKARQSRTVDGEESKGLKTNELKALMDKHNVRPNKKLGQHFLCDQRILDTIASHVTGDRVLEIGPGMGALTTLLAQDAARQVVVWEKDGQFHDVLKDQLPQVQWHQGDALDLPWDDFAGFTVASNLPYNISVPIMLDYAQRAIHVPLGPAVFMMQKEVALRVCAKVNTADYGRLSVMMQTFCTIEWVVNVPPSAFWPQPAVDSIVLKITPRTPSIAVPWDALSDTVEKAFARRRKMLHHNVPLTPEQWQQVDLDRTRRAETLTIEEFARLTHFCQGTRACVP